MMLGEARKSALKEAQEIFGSQADGDLHHGRPACAES